LGEVANQPLAIDMHGPHNREQDKQRDRLTGAYDDGIPRERQVERPQSHKPDRQRDGDFGKGMQSQNHATRCKEYDQQRGAREQGDPESPAATPRQQDRQIAVEARRYGDVAARAEQARRAKLGPSVDVKDQLADEDEPNAKAHRLCPGASHLAPVIVDPEIEEHGESREEQQRRITELRETFDEAGTHGWPQLAIASDRSATVGSSLSSATFAWISARYAGFVTTMMSVA
jgi:hypothetical protein